MIPLTAGIRRVTRIENHYACARPDQVHAGPGDVAQCLVSGLSGQLKLSDLQANDCRRSDQQDAGLGKICVWLVHAQVYA